MITEEMKRKGSKHMIFYYIFTVTSLLVITSTHHITNYNQILYLNSKNKML